MYVVFICPKIKFQIDIRLKQYSIEFLLWPCDVDPLDFDHLKTT